MQTLINKNKLRYCNCDQEPIPINPLRLFCNRSNTGEISYETAEKAADRIVDTIKSGISFGCVQENAVYDACVQGLSITGFDDIVNPNNIYADYIFENLDNYCFSLKTLGFLLNEAAISNKSALTAYNKMKKIIENISFSQRNDDCWKEVLYTEGNVSIWDFSDILSKSTKKVAVNFVLSDLFNYIRLNGSLEKPFLLVVDEVQEIFREESPMMSLLTQGRKYGLSCICTTQYCKFSKNSQVLNCLEQAGTRIIFKPDPSDYRYILRFLCEDKANERVYRELFGKVGRGRCIVHTGKNYGFAPLEKVALVS